MTAKKAIITVVVVVGAVGLYYFARNKTKDATGKSPLPDLMTIGS